MHGEYSIADGTVRIDDAVRAAADDRMPALAQTDLANLFGLVKFYTAARDAGVKPIAGCDAWITHAAERDAPHRALLLAADRAGYLRLCEWLTRAHLGNRHRGRAEIDPAWFDEGTEGLIVLAGARESDVGAALLQGNTAAAKAAAQAWARRFPDRACLEVQRAGHPDDDALVDAVVRLAATAALPVVATHPVQFLRAEDFRAHEARVCIAEGHVLSDPRRPRAFTPQQYFLTQREMAEKFADLPEALANSVAIAQRCNLTIPLGKPHLPAFPTPPGVTLDEHLEREAAAGLERRLAQLYPDEAARMKARDAYVERLSFETKTIVQMGFAGYFLIVADFINWAKTHDVPVGPGRGSGAGSLVAYSLGITDLDPLRYQLLFERFLNPERVSMPDFDIDFCQDGRDRVIDYVRAKYGAASVSQIATFGTMAAKAAVRDVGRVLDLPYLFCDGLAKLIPFQPGKLITLKQAREMEPLLAERESNEEEVRELLALAESLEGLTRNVGMHAGGVLIAPGQLTDFCPLYAPSGAEAAVSQFDKDDVEAIGLVKFDFLGLTTLTILARTLEYVRKLDPSSTLALDDIPLDDPATYKLFQQAQTSAVFQFESRGMRDLLKQAKPDRLDDLIALNALYRPGPMDLIPDYVERKNGRARADYVDRRLEPILGSTYGVMVYQEQVMQIAQVIGGYTLGGADLLRRAMGKKKPEEMAKHRDVFVAGAEKNGLARAKAVQLFDLMEKFAGYGFNKSHSAAYALVAYQTAWLKVHHPAAFMAANLSLVMDDTDKVRALRDDALAMGLEVLPPDVNASLWRFEPVDAKRIRYGLGGIKGTGEQAVASIVAAREAGGAFRGLADLAARVDKRLVNRRVLEALVKAGAFDAIDARRATLFASVANAMQEAERAQAQAAQSSLFGGEVAAPAPVLVETREWSDAERLQHEKTALGFYLSGHPYAAYAAELAPLVRTALPDVAPRAERYLIAGVVTAQRTQSGRKGKIAFVTLDDGKGSQEVVVFNEAYEQARALLREDALVVIEVKVTQRMAEDGEVTGLRILAEQVFDLPAVRKRWGRKLRLSCNGNATVERLESILAPFKAGGLPVLVHYAGNASEGDLDLPDDWRVTPDEALIARLADWLAPQNVTVQY